MYWIHATYISGMPEMQIFSLGRWLHWQTFCGLCNSLTKKYTLFIKLGKV